MNIEFSFLFFMSISTNVLLAFQSMYTKKKEDREYTFCNLSLVQLKMRKEKVYYLTVAPSPPRDGIVSEKRFDEYLYKLRR